jgi:dolichol-phosphate mannosyltransferase
MASQKVMREHFSRQVMLSVVVPTYRERESLPELVGRIESSLKPIEFEIIIVDDASPDGTADCAEYLNRKFGNIKIVKRGSKLGLSSAVLDGFETADAPVLAVIDADLQHPPELLPRMYTKICDGYDLIVASRYAEGGVIEGLSLRRRIVSKGATSLAHALLPRTRKVRDIMSGFFMLRRDVIKEVKLNTVGFKILLEIIVRGNYSSVTEVPYTFIPRKRGKSNLNLRELGNYIVQIYRLL